MSSRGHCVFNPKWESNPAYNKWVKAMKGDKRKALCRVCDTVIEISTMGESGLKSHMKGAKHQRNVGRSSAFSSISSFISKSECDTGSSRESDSDATETLLDFTVPPPPTSTVTRTDTRPLSSYVTKEDVTKAEILWTLKLVTDHQSYRSTEESNLLFRAMFPDSTIAKQFTCGEKKAAYVSVFGIGQHVLELLKKSVSESGLYVILFDESLNSKMQEKQMDIHIRFWNIETNKVDTRYLTSEFLGHGTAVDMISHFTHSVLESGLNVPNMLQVSMDGPNVNWKFLQLLQDKLSKDHTSKLINIGSCGLHIVHNSFKAGAESTGWKVASFLSGLHYLFKDSPARREDFTKVPGVSMLPLKFVSHRWLENVPVCERAIVLWDKIVAYVKAVESKKLPKPTCKSYQAVLDAVQDSCFLAKLNFFKVIALQLQPFLSLYQSNKPMVCFLCEDLVMLIRSLMRRFMKSEKLEKLDEEQLVKVDVTDKELHVTYSKVEVGFSCEKALKQKSSYTDKKASERQVLDFKMNCKNFLIHLLKKLLLKCPVSYSLVRHLSCLSPGNMASAKEDCIQKFKKLLHILLSAKRVEEIDCDVILEQFVHFMDSIPKFGTDKFTNFDKTRDSADEFFHLWMCQQGRNQQFQKIFSVVKMILTLSHGQAAVERGFSINKEIEVENMRGQTLMAHRAICDHVHAVGGILKVQMTNALLMSVKFSRQRYETYLENERQKKKSAVEKQKRKSAVDEIEEIKKKKRRIEQDINTLNNSADELSLKAEATKKMAFVVQSNALRKSARDKQLEMTQLSSLLDEKVEILKTC